MPGVRVSTVIDASPDAVWAAIEDVATHVEWMADAETIRITSEQRQGLGTTFECDTKVGPARTTDVMEITEWEPGRALGVRHRGVVSGTGRFTLAEVDGGTEFAWDEELRFPWYLGGRAGAVATRPVLRRVWRGNLERLRRLVERDS